MLSDPQDKSAYRIAVGAIGLALIIVLVGLCVIVAVGEGKEIPKELWTITSALGGGLLGLLAPAPTPSVAATKEPVEGLGQKLVRAFSIFAKDVWANRSVVILLFVFIVAAVLGAMVHHSSQLQALAAASGGALIGLLAPGSKGAAEQ